MSFYVYRDEQSYGPYPQEMMEEMIQRGQVAVTDLLYQEGDTEWRLAPQLLPHCFGPINYAEQDANAAGRQYGQVAQNLKSTIRIELPPRSGVKQSAAARAAAAARARAALSKTKSTSSVVAVRRVQAPQPVSPAQKSKKTTSSWFAGLFGMFVRAK